MGERKDSKSCLEIGISELVKGFKLISFCKIKIWKVFKYNYKLINWWFIFPGRDDSWDVCWGWERCVKGGKFFTKIINDFFFTFSPWFVRLGKRRFLSGLSRYTLSKNYLHCWRLLVVFIVKYSLLGKASRTYPLSIVETPCV